MTGRGDNNCYWCNTEARCGMHQDRPKKSALHKRLDAGKIKPLKEDFSDEEEYYMELRVYYQRKSIKLARALKNCNGEIRKIDKLFKPRILP